MEKDTSKIQYDIWTVMSEMMKEGSGIDLKTLDELPAIAYNGGSKCDVLTGPCSCGASHSLNEQGRKYTVYGKILKEKYDDQIF